MNAILNEAIPCLKILLTYYAFTVFNTGMVIEAWLAMERGAQCRGQNTVTIQWS